MIPIDKDWQEQLYKYINHCFRTNNAPLLTEAEVQFLCKEVFRLKKILERISDIEDV